MDESSDEADNEDDDGDYLQDRPGKRKRNSGGRRKGMSIFNELISQNEYITKFYSNHSHQRF